MIRHASPSTSVLTLSIICPGVVDHAPHSTAPYGLTPLPLMRARTTPYEMAYGNTTHKPMRYNNNNNKNKKGIGLLMSPMIKKPTFLCAVDESILLALV